MILRKFCFFSMFMAGVLFYSYLSYVVGANSDNMSSLLMAKDFSMGNYLLDGWKMSTQSYVFSDMIWTALAIKVFGYHPLIAHILPGFFYCIACYAAIKLSLENGKSSALLIVPTLLLPTLFTIANAAELNIHTGIYAFSSLVILFLAKKERNISYLTVIALAFITGAFSDSDKLILFTFVLPVLVSSLFHLFLSRRIELAKIFSYSILSIIFYKLFGVLNAHIFNYITPGIGSQGLASTDIIIKNIKILIDGLLLYFGVSPSDENVAVNVFRILCLISFLVSFTYASIKRWKSSFIDTMLLIASVVPVAAFIFSTVAIDVTSNRFIFFSFFSASILIARAINIKRLSPFVMPVIVVLSIANLSTFSFGKENEEQFYARLGVFLKDNGLTHGYAGFWSASITTAVSDVNVYPVKLENSIKPMDWLSKDSWYTGLGNFFIARNKEEEAMAINEFGDPDRKLSFENLNIMAWELMPMPPYGYSISKIFKDNLPTLVGRYEDGKVIANHKEGFLLFGPYISLKKGDYTLKVKGNSASEDNIIDVIDNSKGKVIIKENLIFKNNGFFSSNLHIDEDINNMEVRVFTSGNSELTINGYSVTPVAN